MSVIIANDSRFRRANANLRCFACLSADRNLKPLRQMSLMATVCPEIFLNATITTHYLICWECQAMVLKIKEFKTKVVSAQSLLKQSINVGNNFPHGLSNLTKTGIELITISPNTSIEPTVNDEPVLQIKTEQIAVKNEIERGDSECGDYDELIEPTSIYQMTSGETTDTASETDCDSSPSEYAVQNKKKRKRVKIGSECVTPIKKVKDTFQPDFKINIKGPNAYIIPIQETFIPRGTKEQVKVTVAVPKEIDPNTGVPDNAVTKITVPQGGVRNMSVQNVAFLEVGVPKVDIPKVTVPDEGFQKVCVPKFGVINTGVPKVPVPDVGFPKVYLRKLALPKASVPKVSVPKVSVPKVSVPKVSVPKVSVPKVSVPKVSVPKVSVPKVSVPKVSVPKVSVAKVSVPKVSVAKVSVPKVSVPKVIVPRKWVRIAPKVGAINTGVPKVIVPKATVPKRTASKATVLKATVPKATLPKATVPKATVPKATVPEVTVPKATVPEVNVPKAAVPEVTVPKVTVPEVTVPKAATVPEINTTNLGISNNVQEGLYGYYDNIEVKCKLVNRYEVNLYRHNKLKDLISKSSLYTCYMCLEWFKTQKNFDAHNIKHAVDQGDFICEICEQRFLDGPMRDSHYKSHFVIYECIFCTCQNHDKLCILEHIRQNHQTSDFPPKKCDGDFKLFKELDTPKLNDLIDKPPNREYIKYSTAVGLRIHAEYKCDYCGKCYESKKRLSEHMQLDHIQNPVVMCEKRVRRKLDHHKNVHLGLPHLKCTACGDASDSGSMDTHNLLVPKEKKKKQKGKAEKRRKTAEKEEKETK